MWFIPQPDISRISAHTKILFVSVFGVLLNSLGMTTKREQSEWKNTKHLQNQKRRIEKCANQQLSIRVELGRIAGSHSNQVHELRQATFFAKKIAIERKKYVQSHFASLTLIIMESFSIFVFIYSGHFCQFRQNLTCFSLLRRFFFSSTPSPIGVIRFRTIFV